MVPNSPCPSPLGDVVVLCHGLTQYPVGLLRRLSDLSCTVVKVSIQLKVNFGILLLSRDSTPSRALVSSSGLGDTRVGP